MGEMNQKDMFLSRLSKYTQRPTNKSKAKKCTQAMVAPAGVPRSSEIPYKLGFITAGKICKILGNTSATYKAAANALIQGEDTMRLVHFQVGEKIIRNQKGMTSKLLSEKILSICFPFIVVRLRANSLHLVIMRADYKAKYQKLQISFRKHV